MTQLHIQATQQASQPPPTACDACSSSLPLQDAIKAPRKCMYRMRAHSNPLNDATFPVPLSPNEYDW